MLSDIQNYYERLVFENIQAAEEVEDQDFLEDVACVALNSLPPRYIRHAIDMASHLTIAERAALDEQVEKAVKNAIKLVKERRAERSEE